MFKKFNIDDNNIFKVCVVATMSSGKSTFINAIIGEEIQKDFFAEAPQTAEMDEKTREILVKLQEELKSIKNDLQQALKAVE